MFCTSAAAINLQQGIHGMKWGSSIAEYSELTKVHEVNQAAYYANSNMTYKSANQSVPGVFYGFYREKFFAVFIKLRSPDQFSHLERQFRTKHGAPKTTHDAANQQTVYRWIDRNLRIKLKMKESAAEYKLAIYYSPLAAKLNEEQLEQMAPEVFGQMPSKKDNAAKSSPLFGF
jgi:hypothetical protein